VPQVRWSDRLGKDRPLTDYSRWPSRAVERFTGPWNHTLASPILVIGNTADPVSSKSGAISVADMLGPSNAVFLEQRGFGHSSFAQASACTHTAVAAYFNNGTVRGTVVY